MNGMTTEGPTRYAAVVGMGITGGAIAAYLPENYKVVSDDSDAYFDGEVISSAIFIEGRDVAGWTLDAYVIPRLASGGFTAREQFLHIEDVGDAENGPRISTWLEDRPMGTDPSWQNPTCAICGEHVRGEEQAEMHDASMLSDPEMFSEAGAGIVHAECGIAKGWQVS